MNLNGDVDAQTDRVLRVELTADNAGDELYLSKLRDAFSGDRPFSMIVRFEDEDVDFEWYWDGTVVETEGEEE